MLEKVEFRFSSPVCGCEESNLKWAIIFAPEVSIQFTCATCRTQLKVPYASMRAEAIFAQPYPGKQAPKLMVHEGGAVVPIRP